MVRKTVLLASVATLLGSAGTAWGQQAPGAETDPLALDAIVVTASPGGATKMSSSVSVSSISADQIAAQAPRSTAEIFRGLPGIRSESTGGEGNANIAVRGLPVASGGAKFLQLQEDGLPVMEFGDIAFGNADIFLRADQNVSRIESVRGGSASTFASNSPGGVINFISKTGETEGGAIALTKGLGYDHTRLDFDYGAPINDTLRFHVGGFYREGEGARRSGYTSEKGGQIKANLTKEFENGFVRLHVKYLNDRAVGYLPMPTRVTGSNNDPGIGSFAGFDIGRDDIQSVFLATNPGLDGDGNRRISKVSDGMHPDSLQFGAETKFDLGGGWKIEDRFKVAKSSGRFVAPFPAEVTSAQTLATEIGGTGATLRYANGPNGGQAIASPSSLNGNGLAMRVHMFDVEINDFGNAMNDLKLSRSFEPAGLGSIDVTVGYYKSRQTIAMDWLWNTFLMEVKGDNAALLDVYDSAGTKLTQAGLAAYGVPYWGNCCTRRYDVTYDIDAPYLSLSTRVGDLSLDASLRRDEGKARGGYAAAKQATVDVNGDGVIQTVEQSVSVVDNANTSPVNYDWGYTSWSFGANYQLNPDLALFARASRGGRANADRLLFGKVQADGSVTKADAVDMVDQVEGGVKFRRNGFGLFATAFWAKTEEQNFEATSQTFFDRVYKAKGVELEASYRAGGFSVTGGATYTDAVIDKDALNPAVVGNTPRRQAKWLYQFAPTWRFGDKATIGASVIGTTKAYAQDENLLVFPGYAQVNAFAEYNIVEGLSVSVNANNLFDKVGLTEAEEGAITAGSVNAIRARSINGRTVTATLRYAF